MITTRRLVNTSITSHNCNLCVCVYVVRTLKIYSLLKVFFKKEKDSQCHFKWEEGPQKRHRWKSGEDQRWRVESQNSGTMIREADEKQSDPHDDISNIRYCNVPGQWNNRRRERGYFIVWKVENVLFSLTSSSGFLQLALLWYNLWGIFLHKWLWLKICPAG